MVFIAVVMRSAFMCCEQAASMPRRSHSARILAQNIFSRPRESTSSKCRFVFLDRMVEACSRYYMLSNGDMDENLDVDCCFHKIPATSAGGIHMISKRTVLRQHGPFERRRIT